jgi:3-oxoacyl-(acyl-carrier-protein) reductase
MSLKGEVALVTGASRGIGRAIAEMLGQGGASVVGTATTEKGATAISTWISQNSLRGRGAVLNVCHPAAIEELIGSVTQQFGAPSILINNAGVTRDNLLMRMKDEEWQSILDIDLTSVYRLCKACLRSMIKARKGRIVNITSVVGMMGNAGQSNYAAAKAGMIGFTRSLARELGSRGITVNAVAPGFIDTDMTRALPDAQRLGLLEQIPLKRLGTPQDVAFATAFLCSKGASYITGITLHVNGGMYMG